MEWLSPITGAIAAALAVPALLLLYFLKLRRREQIVSSTLLWKRAVQDLQVNAPFRMIRRNLLLLLQLLALAAILVALARPVLHVRDEAGSRLAILIDRSASMNATDVAPSRLAEAKRQAKLLVDGLRTAKTWSLSSGAERAMIIAFDSTPKVFCTYTSDQQQLREAIDAIEPTDGGTNLAQAVAVARAFASPAGLETNNRSAETPAVIHVFSDGRIADLDDVSAGKSELRYHAIGHSDRNVALVAMQSRRSYQQPNKVELFAALANFAAAPAECEVQLSLDGNVQAVRAVTVPAAAPAAGKTPEQPGQASVSFTLENVEAGVLEVRLTSKDDMLASDNAAWAVLQAPKRLTALLVTEGNAPLESALRACPLARLEMKKPAEFDALDQEKLSVERPYNLIVLDRHAPAKLPAGNYLIFGPPPPALGLTTKGELKKQFIIDWRVKHPVLNYVNLENLYAEKCWNVALPHDAVVLAEFEGGPALALLRRQEGLVLLAPFNLLDTNWPFDPGFVMFCYNVVTYLGFEAGEEESTGLRVGQPIVVQAATSQKAGLLTGPGGLHERLTSDASGKFRFAGTTRAGVYRLAVDGGPEKLFAVNLLDPAESSIAPAGELTVSGQAVKAETVEAALTNQEFLALLAGLALVVVCLEWWVYNSKIRI